MVTRKFKTFRATAFRLDAGRDESGNIVATVIELGDTSYTAPHSTDTLARKMLRAAGVDCPRGVQVKVEEIAEHTYGVTDEDFLAAATQLD